MNTGLRAVILGAAAGGGVPQPRISPVASVPVTNGDIDHVAGLLTLREAQASTLYDTAEILDVIRASAIVDALAEGAVRRKPVAYEGSFVPAPRLEATLLPVPVKVPLYLEGETVETGLDGEQTFGAALEAEDRKAFYIPGCARMTPRLAARLKGAGIVIFDCTLWQDYEMIRLGVSAKTGARMGHMANLGAGGLIAAFESLDIGRKVFVHVSNTDPGLDPALRERAEANAAGWTIGQDGMEVDR